VRGYDLQIIQHAATRSHSTKKSIKYPPMFGAALYRRNKFRDVRDVRTSNACEILSLSFSSCVKVANTSFISTVKHIVGGTIPE
jgi:hypothetical protein